MGTARQGWWMRTITTITLARSRSMRLHDPLRLFARDVAADLPAAETGTAMYRAAWFYAESARRAWQRVRPLIGQPLPPAPLKRATAADPQSRA